MDVTASSYGYGAAAAIRGMRAYANQSAFSAPIARAEKTAALPASGSDADSKSRAETQSTEQANPLTRSVGFRIGPLAIRYVQEEPEVAPGVSWDDLASEAERLASYDGSVTYQAEHEVAALRSSLAESPSERLVRSVAETPSPSLAVAEQGNAGMPQAAMRKAASAYASIATMAHQTQPGAVWSAVL